MLSLSRVTRGDGASAVDVLVFRRLDNGIDDRLEWVTGTVPSTEVAAFELMSNGLRHVRPRGATADAVGAFALELSDFLFTKSGIATYPV